MATSVLELIDVSLAFEGPAGPEPLLENVNLRIERGDFTVLIGPSGQGKSSLLKLLSGLIAPTSGELLIEGKNWNTLSRAERESAVRKMGMLFQKNALFDSLTCAENVAFPLREVAHASDTVIEEAIGFYLEAVGLSHARNLFPDEISGGMQKRLGIARALALKPEIVLYDDPTAGLDPITSRKIVQLIKDLQAKMNSTVIAVTNDMNRVDQMAKKVIMVVDREAIDCGTPEQTKLSKDARVQQFIHGAIEGPLMVQA